MGVSIESAISSRSVVSSQRAMAPKQTLGKGEAVAAVRVGACASHSWRGGSVRRNQRGRIANVGRLRHLVPAQGKSDGRQRQQGRVTVSGGMPLTQRSCEGAERAEWPQLTEWCWP